MTAGQAPLPLAPLPIRPRPRRGETTESYARSLARANHLRPSYLRAFLCDPPRRTGAIRPWRLAEFQNGMGSRRRWLYPLVERPS